MEPIVTSIGQKESLPLINVHSILALEWWGTVEEVGANLASELIDSLFIPLELTRRLSGLLFCLTDPRKANLSSKRRRKHNTPLATGGSKALVKAWGGQGGGWMDG